MEDGVIAICPVCGERGLLVERDGKRYYHHENRVLFGDDRAVHFIFVSHQV